MISLNELKKMADANNICCFNLDYNVPWNRTSQFYIHNLIDSHLDVEDCRKVKLLSYQPVSYSQERKTFVIEVTIDISLLLS
jgi:hypothetical protein